MIDLAHARSLLEEEESLVLKKHEEALVGVAARCGQPLLAVYDRDLLVHSFIKNEGMSHEGAEEWVGVNIEGGWHGDKTPLILEQIETHLPLD